MFYLYIHGSILISNNCGGTNNRNLEFYPGQVFKACYAPCMRTSKCCPEGGSRTHMHPLPFQLCIRQRRYLRFKISLSIVSFLSSTYIYLHITCLISECLNPGIIKLRSLYPYLSCIVTRYNDCLDLPRFAMMF